LADSLAIDEKEGYMRKFIPILLAFSLLACSDSTSSTPTASAEPIIPLPLEFVHIEGGIFTMGSNSDTETNNPEKSTEVSSFYISKYELTQAQYEATMQTNPSRADQDGKGANYPVENVTWQDAAIYCNKLSMEEGLEPVYYDLFNSKPDEIYYGIDVDLSKNGYRLPTEAEWEYVARAGTSTAYHTGDTISTTEANYDSTGIAEVGSYAPNAWGVYDMHGNVAELVADYYQAGYYDNSSRAAKDPLLDSNLNRNRMVALRGGSWREGALPLRSFHRSNASNTYWDDDIGFRLVHR
jgi:formylglycine-generating enzyme required for sulfatase activity